MKLKSFTVIATLFVLLNLACKVRMQQNLKPKNDLLKLVEKNLNEAVEQYKYLMQQLPAGRLPRSFEKGKLITSDSEWWCSGFYPGSLLYLAQATKDTVLKNEALRALKLLEKEQYNKTTHDLGFMMYCSYGNAARLDPKPEYRQILINSARSLASRFDPEVGCIRSWDSKSPTEFKVIIDNMMNLELLFWATKATGDSSFYDIAVTHANTTIKNHFRPDYSTWHLVTYNSDNGNVTKKSTVQGAADESAWARGQAWGLYGYTVMFRETKDKKYLEQANHIANFILDHPNLPSDKVPYWDFNAPGIPNALRDASAGSIIASALIELAGYNTGDVSRKFFGSAETILATLGSRAYNADSGANGGFILKHSVGNLPGKSEVDVPLSYADYYYVEAMMRYKDLDAN